MTYILIEHGMATLSANCKVPKFIIMAGHFTNSENGTRSIEKYSIAAGCTYNIASYTSLQRA